MNKGFILTVGGIVVLGVSTLASASYYLSDLLIFRQKSKERWMHVDPPECPSWMTDYAYADLSKGQPGSNSKPVDFTCEEAKKLPSQDFHVKAEDGLNIHYKVYDNPVQANAYEGSPANLGKETPLMLHVHGVSGNYLHGTRYFKAASRMGFQLVSMDLTNHGLSDTNGKGAGYGCREYASVVAVIADLQQKYPNRDLIVHSTSMGAMSVSNALKALQSLDTGRKIVSVVFENPIPSVRQIVYGSPQKPPVPDFLIDFGLALADYRAGYQFDTCKPIDNLKYLTVPAAVLQSALDDLVPVKLAREFFEALPPQMPHLYKVYPQGGHSAVWNGAPQEYEADLKAIWHAGLRHRSESLLGKAP